MKKKRQGWQPAHNWSPPSPKKLLALLTFLATSLSVASAEDQETTVVKWSYPQKDYVAEEEGLREQIDQVVAKNRALAGQSFAEDDPNELRRKLEIGGSSSCYYCSKENVSKTLSFEPTLTFDVDSGIKQIDIRSWFNIGNGCQLGYAFYESDWDPLVQRIFLTDSHNPGYLFVRTGNVEESDRNSWRLVVTGINSCDYGRYSNQYFNIIFERPDSGPDCQHIVLTPADWSSTQLTQSLYSLGEFAFSTATVEPEECTTFSMKVVFADDPSQTFFSSTYDVVQTSSSMYNLRGRPTTRSPFVTDSPFRVIIRTTFGIYGNVDSTVATLTITDPCENTAINSQALENMIVEINDPQAPQTQDFSIFTDTISVLYSDQYGDGSGYDICSPQSYEILDSETGSPALFASVAINSVQQIGIISVESNNFEDIDVYDLLLRVTLDDYGKQLDVPFKVTIEQCEVYDIHVTHPDILHINYDVGAPAIEEIIPEVFLTPPDCGQEPVFSLYNEITGQPEPWARLDLDAGVIIFQTDNIDDAGEYYIVLNVDASGRSTATPVDAVFRVTINACTSAQIIESNIIEDFTYSTSFGLYSLPKPFETSLPGCDLTYELQTFSVTNNPFDPSIFALTTDEFQMETNNIAYAGKTFRIIISAYISDPNQIVVNEFFVTVENGCLDISIVPPTPSQNSPFTFDLWSLSTYTFSYATFDPPGVDKEPWYNCGKLKYALVDALTEEVVSNSVFALSTASTQNLRFSGKPTSRDPWLINSPYEYKIIVTLGTDYLVEFSDPFEVVVEDPCFDTNLVSINLGPYVAQVQGDPVLVTVDQIKDTISQTFGGQYGDGSGYDLCGPRTYELFEEVQSSLIIPTFADFQAVAPSLIIEATDGGEAGIHLMQLNVGLEDYPGVQLSLSFEIDIVGCEITQLSVDQPSQTSYNYDIESPAFLLEIPIPSYTVVPSNCDDGDENGINYIINQSPGSPQVIRDGNFLLIETDNPDDFGTLNFSLTLEPASASSVNPVQVNYTVDLNRCKLDEISITTIISDFDFTIGSDAYTVGPNMANLYPECPVTYQLTQQGETPGNYFQGVFNFNSQTGVLRVDDNGVNGLEGASFQLTLEGFSEESDSLAEQIFTVTFITHCQDVQLTPPTFQDQAPVQANLWEDTEVFFNLPSASPPDCASFTYNIYESISGQELDPQYFVTNTAAAIPYVMFTLPSRDPWLFDSPFDITLVATYGSFGEVTSDSIQITVFDTCFETTITPKNIVQLTTYVNKQTPTTRSFSVFTDEVSLRYSSTFGNGSGYDLCGSQSYQIREIINDVEVPSDLVTVDSLNRILTLQTTNPDDSGLHDMLLCVTLDDYDIEYCQPFAALVSDCTVTNLQLTAVSPPGDEITYEIQNNAQALTIPLPSAVYTPAECVYGLNYSVRRLGGGGALPHFLTFDEATGLQVLSGNPNDVGEYIIELTATIDGPNTVNEQDIIYTLTLGRCQMDQISQSSPIGTIEYVIGSGQREIDTNIENLFPECEVTFELTQNGQPYNENIFTLDTVDRTLIIDTDDPNDSDTFEFVFTVTDEAGNTIQNTFEVILANACEIASLQGAQFFTNTATQALFVEESYFITIASISEECGEFSYELLDFSTGQPLSPAIFTVITDEGPQPFIRGTIPARDPYVTNSPLRIQIRTSVEFSSKTALSNPLVITVQDPCFQTEIEPQGLDDMATTVNAQSPVTQTFSPFRDTVSQDYSGDFGDGSGRDLCGEQTYRLFERRQDGQLYPVPNWVTFEAQNRLISIQPNEFTEVGSYMLVLQVELADFAVSIEETFDVFVDDCVVVGLDVSPSQPSTTEFTYDILPQVSTLIIPRPSASIQPSQCAFHGVSYNWSVAGFATLPSFATKLSNGLSISTSQSDFAGVYEIELLMEPNGPSTVDPVIFTYELTITACRVNNIFVAVPQPDLTYYIGTGTETVEDGFESEQPSCEITYTLVEEGTGTYDSSVFTFDPSSPIIQINTDNVAYHLQETTLLLRAKSVLSGDTAQQIFTVTFLDPCRDLILEPVQFFDQTATAQLYQSQKFYFNKAVSSEQSCGEITYRLIDGFTNDPLDQPEFQLNLSGNAPNVQVLTTDKQSAANYDLVIVATVGNYAEVRSDPLFLTINDPCLSTTITSQQIPQLSTTVRDPVISYTVPLFQDSVSAQYSDLYGDGSGTDLCGPQEYQLYEKVNNAMVIVDFAYLTDPNSPRTDINVQTDEQADAGSHTMILEVELVEYGRTLQQQFLILINAGECIITDLQVSPGQDFNLDYDITSPAQAQTYNYPSLDVTPADCAQSYTYEIVIAGTNDAPSYATTTLTGIKVESGDPNDIGVQELELLITPNGLNEVDTVVVPYTLKITGCVFDEVEVGETIGTVVYQINSGPATVSGDFFNLYADDCPFDNEYSLVQVGYGGPGSYDPAIFTFSSSSPTVTIDSTDLNLADNFYELELTATASQTSGSQATDVFFIEFTIGCEDATLEPPIFDETDIVVDMYEPEVITFTPATSSKPSCGPITYKVIDADTNQVIVINKAVVDPADGTLTIIETNKSCKDGGRRLLLRAQQSNIATIDSDILTFNCYDPCLSTTIDDVGLPALFQTSVKRDTPEVFEFTCATDSVSVQYSDLYGDGSNEDICGPRTYELFEVVDDEFVVITFATIQELIASKKISVQTNDSDDVGLHDMVLKITLLDYNIVDYQSFEVDIDECQLTSLERASPNFLDQVYVIGDPTLAIDLPLYLQTPDCDLPIDFAIEVSPDTLPQGTLDLQDGQLLVSADDFNLQGDYQITVIAQAGDITNSAVSFTLMIQTNLPGCSEDRVILSGVPNLTVYYISDPAEFIPVTLTQSADSACPIACTLTQGGSSVGVFDRDLFALNCDTQEIAVYTDDINYDITLTSLTLEVTSILSKSSQKTDSINFIVEVKSICRDYTIEAPEWLSTLERFDFRSNENFVDFTKATFVEDKSCDTAGFTYSLIYENGQVVSPSQFTVIVANPPYVRVTAPQDQYFIYIKATSPYGSVTSQAIEIVVADLCLETQYSIVDTLVEMDLTVLGSSVTATFDKPISELSTILNIPDICGQIEYSLVRQSGPSNGVLTPTINANVPSITAEATSPSQVGVHSYLLISESVFYPQLSIERDLIISVEDCVITLFEYSEALDDIIYIIDSQPLERTIEPYIIRPACQYEVRYDMQLITNTNQVRPLPNGFELIEESNGDLSFLVETSDTNLIGEYVLEFVGSVDDGPQQGTSSSFRFTVLVQPNDEQQENTPPIFVTDPVPFVEATAGQENFTFDMEIPQIFDAEGDNVDIDFDYSSWTGWLKYDPVLRKVIPERSNGKNFDFVPTGTQFISITLTDDSPYGPLSSSYSILVTVNPDPNPGPTPGPDPGPDPGPGPNPPNLIDAEEGIISDITNTGEIVVNLDNGLELSQLLQFYSEPRRRRLMHQQMPHLGLGTHGELRLLTAVDAAIDSNDLITVELIPSPESNPEELGFSWELTEAQDGEVKFKLDFDNPQKVSSQIDNDQIKITIQDPKKITNPKSNDIKAPTVIVQDIVRQIDGGDATINSLIDITYIFQIVWVVVGSLSFIYFLLLTGGREDPFLWSFLETMQLLTHIQLINVKIPGNAALFLNLNNQLFRYDFFPNEWVADVLNLRLIPSPNTGFIQIRYLQVHMLMYTIFIFACTAIVVLLMFATPLIARCSPKTAHSLSKRLYWGVPTRMIFEFYFILALTSWNNMLNDGTADASMLAAYAVLVGLFIYTGYIFYSYFLAMGVSDRDEKEKRRKVREILYFVQRPLRLRRYKPEKFLYPVYYLARRMILALTFVYMQHTYATQWCIWTLLSLGALLLLAKIRPFADSAMNVVQFINELFIFVAAILLMPLCNNLYNLMSRNQIGWCLYGVVLACIIFNILILLLRSCSIFCEYVKARSDLIKRIAVIKIEEDYSSGPFEQKKGASIIKDEPMKAYPTARDFVSFGMAQNVTNSITSMEFEVNNEPPVKPDLTEMYEETLFEEGEKQGPVPEEKVTIERHQKKKIQPITRTGNPFEEVENVPQMPLPVSPSAMDEGPIRLSGVQRTSTTDEIERPPKNERILMKPTNFVEDDVEELNDGDPVSVPANCEPESLVAFEQADTLDQWDDQFAPDNGWELDPEQTTPYPKEPNPYNDPHSGKHVIYMVDEQEPERLQNAANKILVIVIKEKETVVINTHTSSNAANIEPHQHEENDDCPVCAAGKPKVPDIDKTGDAYKQSVDLAASVGESIDFGGRLNHTMLNRTNTGNGDQAFRQRPGFIQAAKTAIYSEAGNDKTVLGGNRTYLEDEDVGDEPQVQEMGDDNRSHNARTTHRQTEVAPTEYQAVYDNLSMGHTEEADRTTAAQMKRNEATGLLYRQGKAVVTRMVADPTMANDDSMNSENRYDLLGPIEERGQLEEGGLDNSGFHDTSANAWQRTQMMNYRNGNMEQLEAMEDEGDSRSYIEGRPSNIDAAGRPSDIDNRQFESYFQNQMRDSNQSSDINLAADSQMSLDIKEYNNGLLDVTESLEQLGPMRENEEGRLRRLQRTVNTNAEQLVYEQNPRVSDTQLNEPDDNVQDSLFNFKGSSTPSKRRK